MKNQYIFAICSPSGAGKSTLINYLLDNYSEYFQRYPTVVSRPMREGEVQGNPYVFVSKQEAQSMIDSGDYIEYELKPYNDSIYGKTKSILNKKLIFHLI